MIFTKATFGAEATIIDSWHYSKVFGEIRNYRIFLPPGYFENPQKKYPVIYFFHGWSQRYFGSSDHYADYDKDNENNGDNIGAFVSSHDVIVVKPDGYNRSPGDNYYVRPYNVSPVETYRQFPIYFPELVQHIDTHYNTLADRGHRGISGLSMGGFMTYWIGAKYPDLLSAAGNFCGSAEFEVGPKDFPVEYRHIDMYKNYGGMNVRLNYGDKDFIRGYHDDLNRIWPQLMENYEYKMYDAAHSTCGMGEMFGFILKTFEHPPEKPAQWHHIDVYPEFSVWDFQVKSDRLVPGFTILENVNNRGFRCSVREFLPDGQLLPMVTLSVTTAPVYEKNQSYVVNDIGLETGTALQKTILSDGQGRLVIALDGGLHEIGINRKTDRPNLSIASVEVANMPWATHKKNVTLIIKLVNKGTSVAKNVSATLIATRKSATVSQTQSSFADLAVNKTASGKDPFSIRVDADSIEVQKFKLTIRDEAKNEWTESFDITFKKDLPEIKDFEIADGKVFTVAKAGIDSATLKLGRGNGDGIANPGESIVVLVRDQKKLWRTDLTFSDPFVNPFGVNVRESDNWGEYDHVGGSAKYHVPLLSSDCPQNHSLDFFVEYWLPDYPYHIIKQGVVKINVSGKDKIPPALVWTKLTGDNSLQVNLSDGSKIQSANAKLTLKSNPSKSLDIALKDDGNSGDLTAGDNVFGYKIPQQTFGPYRVVIEAIDSFGNKITEEAKEDFILH